MKKVFNYLIEKGLLLEDLIELLDNLLTKAISKKTNESKKERLTAIKIVTLDMLKMLVDENKDNKEQRKEYIDKLIKLINDGE